MNEYISKEAVLKKLQMQLLDLEADQDKGEYSELCENRGARDALDEAIYNIRTLKTADVQPVKHGRWIPQGDDMWLCSNCKKNIIYSEHESDRTEKQRYCCRCGARMDGDTK